MTKLEQIKEKKQKIYKLVDSLPPERLDTAEILLEQLQHESRVDIKEGKRIIQLGGLWKHLGIEISEEEIAEARREMWRKMGEDNE